MSKPPHDKKLFGDVLGAALWTGVAAPESAMRNGDASHAAGECHIREPKLLREIAAAPRKSAMLPGRHEDVRELQRCGRTQCYLSHAGTLVLAGSTGRESGLVERFAGGVELPASWIYEARAARRVFGSSAVSEIVTSDTWRHAASVASISIAFAPKLYIGVIMILPNASSAWRSSLHLSRRFVDEGHSEWRVGDMPASATRCANAAVSDLVLRIPAPARTSRRHTRAAASAWTSDRQVRRSRPRQHPLAG